MAINFLLIKQHLQSDTLTEVLAQQLMQLSTFTWQFNKDACHSGMFDENSLQLSILQHDADNHELVIKTGLFIREANTPCPCAGEDITYTELYCERVLRLDLRHHTYALEPQPSKSE